MQQNSGNLQDGQDMFHEGIIVLDRNIRQGKFRGESSLTLYLYSICRFQWMNQIRKKAQVDLQEDHLKMDEPVRETPESDVVKSEQKELLRMILEQLGDRCKRILELWKLSYSMEEIATEMDGRVTVAKLNIDDNPVTPQKYGVRGIPTLMVFKDGELAATKVGALPKQQLLEWVESVV